MEPEITPEEAKAALGNATFLQEQLLGQAPQGEEMSQEAPQDPNSATQDVDILGELDNLKQQFQEELSGIKEENKKVIEDEINKLRNDIQEALKNEQD